MQDAMSLAVEREDEAERDRALICGPPRSRQPGQLGQQPDAASINRRFARASARAARLYYLDEAAFRIVRNSISSSASASSNALELSRGESSTSAVQSYAGSSGK